MQWEQKKINFQLCSKYVNEAKKRNCELVIFPEMTLTGFSMNSHKIAECIENSESIRLFSQLAVKYQVFIHFGLALVDDSKFFNCSLSVNPSGEVIAIYRKIHPFRFAREHQHYSAGNSLTEFHVKDVRFGATICYDLRFPELYSILAQRCVAIINIASWPAHRRSHWETLLKARAIENQVILIGVNRTGLDKEGNFYESSSLIVLPSGEILEPDFVKDQFSIFEIDFSQVANYRSHFPVFLDRRTDLYKIYL
jgi:predicted amidohydrolase